MSQLLKNEKYFHCIVFYVISPLLFTMEFHYLTAPLIYIEKCIILFEKCIYIFVKVYKYRCKKKIGLLMTIA